VKFKQHLQTLKPYLERMSAEVMTIVRRHVAAVNAPQDADRRPPWGQMVDEFGKYNPS
jgi:hypothetical protein